jgi:hypothetical protein
VDSKNKPTRKHIIKEIYEFGKVVKFGKIVTDKQLNKLILDLQLIEQAAYVRLKAIKHYKEMCKIINR